MKPAFLGTIKKNFFGIITAVLSAGVLLGFLFSADGIASLIADRLPKLIADRLPKLSFGSEKMKECA